MPSLLKPDQLASLLRPGMRVFVQGSSSEPTALLEALRATPDACAGVEFIACQIPGLNRVDFAGLHRDARFTGLFVTPEMTESFRAGKVRFMPLAYSGMYRYLEARPIDVALIQVTPAGPDGAFTLGSSAHFAPAVLSSAKTVVAEINEDLPIVGQSVSIDRARLDYVLPTAHGLPEIDPGPPADVSLKIGAHIAELVRDGDRVQVGIGKVPSAVLDALRAHRGLVCHGGLISDAMIDLQEAGALDPASPLTCTSVIGTKRLYDWVRDNDQVHVRPVGDTHDVGAMADLERFVAINSVLAVDLGGQANAETVNGRQVGGSGGLSDFVRGAQLSRGGRSILALPSTAGRGTISRIVPALANDIASCPRVDADYVVTEHGIADLRYKSLEERAESLIAIADPSFRNDLSDR
ncbi:MAG: 4-hydroxybutyrate CoA-transferase [Alphaproteobacteria bacterium]|nr:4-hydroxybutyrate CoA-transferase [Alphaproteobacteria bacterium]